MARDGSGNMALLAGNPIPYGTRPASSALQNSTLADLATEITDSLNRSGKGGMLANLNMGSFSLTNLTSIIGATTITGALTLSVAPVLSAMTASRVPVTDGTKNLISSSVTATELGHLSGVTSGVQAQLNDRPTAAAVAASYLTIANAASTYLSQATAASTYAPLASPDFSGTPTISAAAIATQAWVGTNFIDTTEIASYLTIAAAAATYATSASPTLTGTASIASATVSGTITIQGGSALGKITVSTGAPSGGNNGDIWFQY